MKEQFPYVGTAGWSLPANTRQYFAAGASLLERYAQTFNAVEINSSFYRPHQKKTYEKWADATPANFKFSVKMPRTITHTSRLKNCESFLDRFIEEVNGLQNKLGVILIQLPPSLAFEQGVALDFFKLLRNKHLGPIVLEPRHLSWSDATHLLNTYTIQQVIADPVVVPLLSNGVGCHYYRLHGSPHMYTSTYSAEFLAQLKQKMNASQGHPSWVIFDNTALGAATKNALDFKALF